MENRGGIRSDISPSPSPRFFVTKSVSCGTLKVLLGEVIKICKVRSIGHPLAYVIERGAGTRMITTQSKL